MSIARLNFNVIRDQTSTMSPRGGQSGVQEKVTPAKTADRSISVDGAVGIV